MFKTRHSWVFTTLQRNCITVIIAAQYQARGPEFSWLSPCAVWKCYHYIERYVCEKTIQPSDNEGTNMGCRTLSHTACIMAGNAIYRTPWFSWHQSHSLFIMMVADGLVLIWCQVISNRYDDMDRVSAYHGCRNILCISTLTHYDYGCPRVYFECFKNVPCQNTLTWQHPTRLESIFSHFCYLQQSPVDVRRLNTEAKTDGHYCADDIFKRIFKKLMFSLKFDESLLHQA